MRRLLLFLLLAFPAQGFAVSTYVGGAIAGWTSGPTITTTPFNNTGSTICYATWAESTSGASGLAGLSDSVGNTPRGYHVDVLVGTVNLNTAYFKHPATSTSYSVTITGNHLASVAVQCFNIASNSGPLDTRNTNVTVSDDQLTTGSVTPSDSGNVAIAAITGGSNAGVGIGSSFTGLMSVDVLSATHWSLAVAYKIGLSGAQNPEFTWTSATAMVSQITSISGSGVIGQTTYHAATCENKMGQTDIQAAIDQSDVGDTVEIPPGTCTITTSILMNKAITLHGDGIDSTILRNGVAAASMLVIGLSPSGQLTRLTGITFNNNGGSSGSYGAIQIAGVDTLRVDHIKIDHVDGFGIFFYDAYGVVDNNIFLAANANQIMLYTFHSGTSGIGSESWSDPLDYSSGDWLFVETNTFIYDDADRYCSDGSHGERFVARFNTITNCSFQVHGTESSYRGGVASQAYKNVMNGTVSLIQGIRSGTAMVWGNTVETAGATAVNLVDDRTIGAFYPFLAATGHNVWDVNANSSMAYLTDVVATGGSFPIGAATGYVDVSGAGWTPHQYIGYTINKTSMCAFPQQCTSVVIDNTATRMTFTGDSGFSTVVPPYTPNEMGYTSGETFSIYKLVHTLDQPGVTGGALLVGDPPAEPMGGNTQVVTPIYQWLNTADGASPVTYVNPNCPTCHENVEYYDYTTMFDGTEGVGSGVRATMNAITTCTEGVAFWVTNEGNWNGTDDGGQGRLYICNGSNTWVLSYTPYTYPHPLVSGTIDVPPVPEISSISPTSGIQGQSLSIAIVGNAATSWINGSTNATFSDPGITVTSTTCADASHCTAAIVVASDAHLTTSDLTMTTIQ